MVMREHGGVLHVSVVAVWELTQAVLCVPGGAGETAAAGQPHPGGLRQRKDGQERQLVQICKTGSHLCEALHYFEESNCC